MNSSEDRFLNKIDAVLRHRGFVPVGNRQSPSFDVVYGRGAECLVVEAKVIPIYRAREFRAVIGDAILRFQSSQQAKPARQLLAIELGRMGRDAEADFREYAGKFLPELCWVLASRDGDFRLHLAPDDDEFIAGEKPRRSGIMPVCTGGGRALFSPKSQWLWKSILMPGIGSRYWSGPDQPPHSISELVERSGVSQPAVSSFIGRAEDAGFLKRDGGGLVVVNHRELLDDWVHAAKNGRRQVIGVRSIYGAVPEAELLGRIRDYCRKASEASARAPIVVGSHLACHLLGLGRSNQRGGQLHVGATPVETVMDALELVPEAGVDASLALVVDGLCDSISRGCVMVEGVPVADALQCYIDVRPSYARGREQADHIFERVLQPHFERP
jgi:hypothetical protein